MHLRPAEARFSGWVEWTNEIWGTFTELPRSANLIYYFSTSSGNGLANAQESLWADAEGAFDYCYCYSVDGGEASTIHLQPTMDGELWWLVDVVMVLIVSVHLSSR